MHLSMLSMGLAISLAHLGRWAKQEYHQQLTWVKGLPWCKQAVYVGFGYGILFFPFLATSYSTASSLKVDSVLAELACA